MGEGLEQYELAERDVCERGRERGGESETLCDAGGAEDDLIEAGESAREECR